jgi:hypothetical protein
MSAVILAAVCLAGRCAQADEAATTPTKGVIQLFDGHSLGDCYTWLKDGKRDDPRRVFSVRDRTIHVSGDGLGALVTNKRYRDYHLVLEFKWGERTWHGRVAKARDSGLLVHSNGADGAYDGCWMPSIEVQIIEGGVGDLVPVPGSDATGKPVPIAFSCEIQRDRDGEPAWHDGSPRELFAGKTLRRVNWSGRDPDWEDSKGFRGANDVDSAQGQWTRIDVICEGDHITNYVNGVKVNEAFDVAPREGRLQLQSELAEIVFRRWELWPIGKGPSPAPAEQELR